MFEERLAGLQGLLPSVATGEDADFDLLALQAQADRLTRALSGAQQDKACDRIRHLLQDAGLG